MAQWEMGRLGDPVERRRAVSHRSFRQALFLFSTSTVRMSDSANPLDGVEAYVFDVFGTVVDWYGSVTRALELVVGAPESLKIEGEIRIRIPPAPNSSNSPLMITIDARIASCVV